jgi:hypothetical protein
MIMCVSLSSYLHELWPSLSQANVVPDKSYMSLKYAHYDVLSVFKKYPV